MPKPRVFVSSVMVGFTEYREAARRGITAAGCDPVLVEDFPSLAASPRNACFDGIKSCDAVAVVVGERGGWTAPSGKLVVEEEFEFARGRSLPTVAFIGEGKRDEDAERLAKQLSEFVHGKFRRTFETPADLEREVEAACRVLAVDNPRNNMDKARFDALLARPAKLADETVLRVVVATGLADETVFDLDLLGDEEFKYELVELGTARDVRFFHQNEPRKVELARNSLVVAQNEGRNSHVMGTIVRAEVYADGWLVMDANVTGRDESSRRDSMTGLGLNPVVVEDVSDCAIAALRFAQRLFDKVDPFGRHVGLLCNASLGALSYRLLVPRSEVGSKRQQGSMGFGRESSSAVTSFDQPERVSRADATWPDTLGDKIARRLRHRVNTPEEVDRRTS